MDTPKTNSSRTFGGGGWTLPFLCAGVAILAACLLLPQAQENQKLMWQCERMRLDLDQLQRQSKLNETFISKLTTDPVLHTRLAERHLGYIERGSKVLDLGEENAPGAHSPYPMVVVAPAPELATLVVPQDKFANMIQDPQKRLTLIGAGLFLVAFGLILGSDRT